MAPSSPNSIFGVSGSAANETAHATLDSMVEKIAQRIASAQPHTPPPVVVFPSAASISASPAWVSALPLGLIAASTFALFRLLGSRGGDGMSAVAQVGELMDFYVLSLIV
jgi:hypothetical protein